MFANTTYRYDKQTSYKRMPLKQADLAGQSDASQIRFVIPSGVFNVYTEHLGARKTPQQWQKRGSSTIVLGIEYREWVERVFVLECRAEVLEFLEVNPDIAPLIAATYYQIPFYFESAPLVLRVEDGFDEDDEEPQLALYIPTDLPPAEALAKLRELDQNWWLDAMDLAHGKMTVNIMYR